MNIVIQEKNTISESFKSYPQRILKKNITDFYSAFAFGFRVGDIESKSKDFYKLFSLIRDRVPSGTKFRSVKNLGVVALYIFLKKNLKLIPLPRILGYYQINYHDFVTNLNAVLRRYPEFKTRDKKVIVKSFIRSILTDLKLNNKVIQNALILFEHFHPYMQYTKEEVVSAVICALTVITSDIKTIKMTDICSLAGVDQSNLGAFFARKIVPHIGVKTYTTLRKSSYAIRKSVRSQVELHEVDTSSFIRVSRPLVRTFNEPPLLIAKVVELRRGKTSLKKIAMEVDLTPYKVRRILERKLPDYQSYGD